MELELPRNLAGNPQVVAAIENLLREAKAGRLSSVGFVTVSPLGQINASMAGGQALEVYFASDLLKSLIKDAMTQGGARPMQMVG